MLGAGWRLYVEPIHAEALDFGTHPIIGDATAIVKATVPKPLLEAFEFSRRIDPFIFKNGVVTVPGSKLDLLNKSLLDGIKTVFQ